MIALHDLLDVARPPGVLVCRDGDVSIDFDAFRARTVAMATALQTQQAHRYALCTDDPLLFACALFALFAAGKHVVIPANATPGHLADLADAYDVLLDDPMLAGYLPDAIAHQAHHAYPSLTIAADAPLTLYTSGSSGAPKPVHKTLAQFDAEVRTLEAQWGELAAQATVLASVPHHHIYGMLFRLFWPLAAGRAFDRATCLDPQQLQTRIAQYGKTVVVSTPAQLSRWPALPGFASLNPMPVAFFSSGGPLAPETAAQFAALIGHAPLEIYGSTETGGIAWRTQSETLAWQAMPGIDVRRTDDGALELRSPHLGHDAWHRTDDEIAIDDDARFRLVGRFDRVIKLEGKRVSMVEIEAQLQRHPFVSQCTTTRLEGTSRTRIGALVVLSDAGKQALRADGRVALVKTLRRHLAAYFDLVVLPRHWRFREALPYDARGKLQAHTVASAFDVCADGYTMLTESHMGDERVFEMHVPRTLAHFAGHFEGLPILPGVVQIDWAVKLSRLHAPTANGVASIDQLKFTAPVPPDAVLQLTMTHEAARRRVRFAYRLGARGCTSGIIVYRESA